MTYVHPPPPGVSIRKRSPGESSPLALLGSGEPFRRFAPRPPVGPLARTIHVDVEIGRRYRAGGKQRSYASARCSDNILQTHGRFSFEDGTVIDGLVEKYCHSK